MHYIITAKCHDITQLCINVPYGRESLGHSGFFYIWVVLDLNMTHCILVIRCSWSSISKYCTSEVVCQNHSRMQSVVYQVTKKNYLPFVATQLWVTTNNHRIYMLELWTDSIWKGTNVIALPRLKVQKISTLTGCGLSVQHTCLIIILTGLTKSSLHVSRVWGV